MNDEQMDHSPDGLVSATPLKRPAVMPAAPSDAVTDAMVDAYLKANDAYWKQTDQLPSPPDKWRTGTPREATRVSLAAALSQSMQPQAEPAAGEQAGAVADEQLDAAHKRFQDYIKWSKKDDRHRIEHNHDYYEREAIRAALAVPDAAIAAREQGDAYSDPACQRAHALNRQWDSGFDAGYKTGAASREQGSEFPSDELVDACPWAIGVEARNSFRMGWKAKHDSLAAQQAPAQPVLCVSSKEFKRMRAGDDHIKAWLPPSTKAEDMLLYTTPQPAAPAQPPRQGGARGLTDDQIADLWMYRKSLHDGNLMLQLRDFARAIERAHGIGER